MNKGLKALAAGVVIATLLGCSFGAEALHMRHGTIEAWETLTMFAAVFGFWELFG